MPVLQSVAAGEWFVVVGLGLNIAGVYALTMSGILGKKPARTLLYLRRDVDRDNPEDTDAEPPVDSFGPVGGGLSSALPPRSTDSYENVYQMVRNQLLGVGSLFIGFGLQVVGTLI